MSKSSENLKTAFAGESMANRRYLFFAQKADQEGFPGVARLFRGAAAAETVHAKNHFRANDSLDGTLGNLKVAIANENYEVVTMYPDMQGEAEVEGNKRAVQTFTYALAVEKIHEALYRQAAESLSQGKDIPEVEYYVCPVCGNTHVGPLVGRCPICNTPGEKFEKVV